MKGNFWTLWQWQKNSASFHHDTVHLLDWSLEAQKGRLQTVAQSLQNQQASCRRCLLLSMTLQIHCQGGAKPGCSLSLLADDQMSFTKNKWGAAMTHDAICHQVMAWCHSGSHLRCLHKWTELGTLKHKICAHDHTIRSIACRCWSIVEPGDGLLQHALDAPRRRRDRHRALHQMRA